MLTFCGPPIAAARAPLYVIEDQLAALIETAELVSSEQEQQFRAEFQTALTAAVEKRDHVGQFLAHLEQLLRLRVDQSPAENSVLRLARAHRLSVYDAAYLELAQRTDDPGFIRVESGTFVGRYGDQEYELGSTEAGVARAIRRINQLRREMESEVARGGEDEVIVIASPGSSACAALPKRTLQSGRLPATQNSTAPE